MRTKEDLQRLIDNEVEESTILEYKSSFATQNPKWREELAKDISAMANSNGGTIVFGIKQKDIGNGHAIAHRLTPIPSSEMSKDKLSQLLSSNIQPIINNLEITYIPDSLNGGYFIVDIPQSNTAHQNRLTHIYYKRRNATVEAMEDYEIRDIMNRNKTPIINLEFQLVRTTINVIKRDYSLLMTRGVQEQTSQRIEYRLEFRPNNNGQVLAKYINYFVYIPSDIVVDKENLDMYNDYCIVFVDNTTRDLVDFSAGQRKYGPVRYDPILPGICGRFQGVDLCFDNVDTSNLPCIMYEVHADNAPSKTITIEWTDLEALDKTKTEIISPLSPPNVPGY